MTTRNKKKLTALNKEKCGEHPRSNLAQNSNAPRSQEDYVTQVSEEIERRVTKRWSKEFSRTENPILGALARLDDFLMNPLLQGHSGTTPEPSRNALITNQGTNEDNSQNDPHPEAGLFHGQMIQNSGPEIDYDSIRYTMRVCTHSLWKATRNALYGCMDCDCFFLKRFKNEKNGLKYVNWGKTQAWFQWAFQPSDSRWKPIGSLFHSLLHSNDSAFL